MRVEVAIIFRRPYLVNNEINDTIFCVVMPLWQHSELERNAIARLTPRAPLICSLSDRQIAAIHRDRAAGHPARLVGGEEQHRADKVVRLTQPAERDHRLGGAAGLPGGGGGA